MLKRTRRTVRELIAGQGVVVIGLLLAGIGRAEDAGQSGMPENVAPKLSEPESSTSTSLVARPYTPLNLLFTQAELRLIVRNYEIKTGEVLTGPIDEKEVIVTAPRELAPMRDLSQDAWGGIAAPFWAIMHPKDAWRIFVPIPPAPERK